MSKNETVAFTGESAAISTLDTFGVLELILSFGDTRTLMSTTLVNRRWKEAGRNDALWKAAASRLWNEKKGFCIDQSLFWRSMFSKEAVSKLTESQIRSVFSHPLLSDKKSLAESITDKTEYQRFYQIHMLDMMSDESICHRFFSDIYFGSFASSVLDSRRNTISQPELCTPHGFDMYFKISLDEVNNDDRSFLEIYDEGENVLLYHHSTCFFQNSRDFRIALQQNVHSYHPANLNWRWMEQGKEVQVGPYPPLTVTRRKDWGWKLENGHVVLLFRDAKSII